MSYIISREILDLEQDIDWIKKGVDVSKNISDALVHAGSLSAYVRPSKMTEDEEKYFPDLIKILTEVQSSKKFLKGYDGEKLSSLYVISGHAIGLSKRYYREILEIENEGQRQNEISELSTLRSENLNGDLQIFAKPTSKIKERYNATITMLGKNAQSSEIRGEFELMLAELETKAIFRDLLKEGLIITGQVFENTDPETTLEENYKKIFRSYLRRCSIEIEKYDIKVSGEIGLQNERLERQIGGLE